MARKSLSFCLLRAAACVILLSASIPSRGDTNEPARPKFLGADSCASSGCHGGGGTNFNQSIVWSLRDVHHARPVATLTTARSRQISAALKIADPTTASDCVSCHAPLREIPSDLRGPLLRINEGVSCESCHGAAENWLRSHTRRDYTHADRVTAGMRDLKDLYTRANTCVACHQTVALPLLAAGHPELIFELDGQSAAQPRHWRDTNGPQAWLVGQAAALREISWQMKIEQSDALAQKRDALVWLLQKTDGEKDADKLARKTAADWSDANTSIILKSLANTSTDFADKKVSNLQHARRAERLVLALDRLAGPNAPLEKLFQLVQSIPDFDPQKFADELKNFAGTLK